MILKESSIEYKFHDDIELMGDQGNNEFNLSACIHILDHCYEPKKLLLNLNRKLISNGILLIVVHNPDSSLAKLLGKRWPPYCSQHPQLFTKKGMKEICNFAGFEIIKQGRTFNNFAMSMITNFLGLELKFAKKVNLRLPLGNMFYTLRKI